MTPTQAVLITLGAIFVIKMFVLLIVGKGSLSRLGIATRAFIQVMGDPDKATRVAEIISRPPTPPEPPGPSPEPLRLLALLQREARVLDFFLEDVSQAPDEALGAGVREVHGKAQAVLREHLVLEPVLPEGENSAVEVPAGFDPWAIRLTGNVTGSPPFRGTLIHHGWRVKNYNLPAPADGQDEFVVAPAEVDVA